MFEAKRVGGDTFLADWANTAAGGGLYGGLIGSGTGDTMGERARNAVYGAGTGLAVGAGIAPVVKGSTNLMGALRGKAETPIPKELQEYGRPAVDKLSEVMGGAVAEMFVKAVQTKLKLVGFSSQIGSFTLSEEEIKKANG